MKPKTYNVNLTKPWQLFFFVFSSIGLFFLTNFVLQQFDLDVTGAILALLFSIVYFFILKKHLILTTELRLSKNEIVVGDKPHKLEDISYYKTHRMRGAGIKLKMKDGKTLKVSSNDYFCKTDQFVRFLNDFEKIVSNRSDIIKLKSIGQTKFGLYFAISATVFLIFTIIFHAITGEYHELSWIAMMLVALTTLWSGIEIKKTFANKK